MEGSGKLTVEECRELLGADGEGWTDERIERLRDQMEALAQVLVPIVEKMIRDGVKIEKRRERHIVQSASV